MKAYQLTYLDFLGLSESERLEYQEMCICATPIDDDIECLNWKWGQVKFCQDTLLTDCTYKDVLDIVKIQSARLTEASPAHVVLNIFNSIKKSIEQITQIEAIALSHDPTPKELAASMAIGGFGQFGTLPQTLSMVGVVASSVKEIEDYDWAVVFNAMAYKHREAQFQKLLYK